MVGRPRVGDRVLVVIQVSHDLVLSHLVVRSDTLPVVGLSSVPVHSSQVRYFKDEVTAQP